MGKSAQELLAELEATGAKAAELKVLVVDDEPVILTLFEQTLEELGVVFLSASGGAEGLQVIEAERPHLVITDKNMPDVNGLEVVQRGKKILPESEFIILTGYASLASSMEALKHGASGYLVKPFDVDDILEQIVAALRKAIDRRRLESMRSSLERATASLRQAVGFARDKDGNLRNRRRYGRVSIHRKVRVKVDGTVEHIEASARDISFGGMFVVHAGVPPGLGTTVSLTVDINGAPCVVGTGRVVRHGAPSEPPGFGVAFVEAETVVDGLISDEIGAILQQLRARRADLPKAIAAALESFER